MYLQEKLVLMNIAVILLTLNRSDYSIQVINQNFKNSGYNADCFLIDNGSNNKEFIKCLNNSKSLSLCSYTNLNTF